MWRHKEQEGPPPSAYISGSDDRAQQRQGGTPPPSSRTHLVIFFLHSYQEGPQNSFSRLRIVQEGAPGAARRYIYIFFLNDFTTANISPMLIPSSLFPKKSRRFSSTRIEYHHHHTIYYYYYHHHRDRKRALKSRRGRDRFSAVVFSNIIIMLSAGSRPDISGNTHSGKIERCKLKTEKKIATRTPL